VGFVHELVTVIRELCRYITGIFLKLQFFAGFPGKMADTMIFESGDLPEYGTESFALSCHE